MADVDLFDYVEVLSREVNPLGSTVVTSPATEEEMGGFLQDAFWEAKLDGFLGDYEVDEDGIVTSPSLDDEFPRSAIALVVVYAGVKILRNRILSMNTQFRAKAGPVEFERQNSATMLTELLKELQATKVRFIELIRAQTPVYGFDAFSTRLLSAVGVLEAGSYYGSIELT